MRSLPTPLHALLYDTVVTHAPPHAPHLEDLLSRLSTLHEERYVPDRTLAWAATLAHLHAEDALRYPASVLTESLELLGVGGGAAHRAHCPRLSRASPTWLPYALTVEAWPRAALLCEDCSLPPSALDVDTLRLQVTPLSNALATLTELLHAAPTTPTGDRYTLSQLVRAAAALLSPTCATPPSLRAPAATLCRELLHARCSEDSHLLANLALLAEIRPDRLRATQAVTRGGLIEEVHVCVLPPLYRGQDPLVSFLTLALPVLGARASVELLLAPAELAPRIERLGGDTAPLTALPSAAVLEAALGLYDPDTPLTAALALGADALAV